VTRTMYDGIAADAHLIPTTAQIVAGYVDGLYKWSQSDWDRFPNSVKVRIAAFATTNDGEVLDCEPGNCTPAESVDWVLMRRRAGKDPTVYCNQLDPDVGWPAVRAAFRARGVVEPHYWVADYPGSYPNIPAGAIGLQYTDTGSYDLSVIADHWPGVDPAPTPQEIDMGDYILQFNPDPKVPDAGSGIFLLQGGKLLAFATVGTALAFKNQFNLQWLSLVDGGTLANFNKASAGQTTEINLTDAQVQELGQAVDAGLLTALSTPSLLAAQGTAYAHAEAVEEHNETPAS